MLRRFHGLADRPCAEDDSFHLPDKNAIPARAMRRPNTYLSFIKIDTMICLQSLIGDMRHGINVDDDSAPCMSSVYQEQARCTRLVTKAPGLIHSGNLPVTRRP